MDIELESQRVQTLEIKAHRLNPGPRGTLNVQFQTLWKVTFLFRKAFQYGLEWRNLYSRFENRVNFVLALSGARQDEERISKDGFAEEGLKLIFPCSEKWVCIRVGRQEVSWSSKWVAFWVGLLRKLPCFIGIVYFNTDRFCWGRYSGRFSFLVATFGNWPWLRRWEKFPCCYFALHWGAWVNRAWFGYFFCALIALLLDCCFGNGPVEVLYFGKGGRNKGCWRRHVTTPNVIENYSRKTLPWVQISFATLLVEWGTRFFIWDGALGCCLGETFQRHPKFDYRQLKIVGLSVQLLTYSCYFLKPECANVVRILRAGLSREWNVKKCRGTGTVWQFD